MPGWQQFLSRGSVQAVVTVVLLACAILLAVDAHNQQTARREVLIHRFDSRAQQAAALLDDVVLAGGHKVKEPTHLNRRSVLFVERYLHGLSATPGFQAAMFNRHGQLLAETSPGAAREMHAGDRTAATGIMSTLHWRLVISVPTHQLEATLGSDTFVWLLLVVLLVSTFMRTVLMRALSTRNRQIEETAKQLAQRNIDLDAFASAAAHDLRAPLRRIASFLELIVRDEKLSERGRNYIDRCERQAQRLDTTIGDLVAYSREGMRVEEHREVSLQAAAMGAIDQLDTNGSAIGIPRTLPTVPGNQASLQQVFVNLISNGLKFVPAGQTPRVDITYTETSSDVTIRVRDHGIGIEDQYREQVFQPFQRLHGFDEYQGTGLGLATCARIVRAHGGDIRALAPADGDGLLIEFTLPKEPPK